MSKYTPGPWKVFNAWQNTSNQSIQFTRIGNDEKTVIRAEESQVEIIATNEADLNLIAVAPELLEALEGFLRAMDKMRLEHHYIEERRIARVAIAKATGK